MSIEELEVKNEVLNKKINDLESDNSSVSIRLEVAKGQISNQNDKLEMQAEKIKNIEAEKDTLDVILLFYLVLKFQQYRFCYSQYFVSTISLVNRTGGIIMSPQHLSGYPGLLTF